LIEYLSVLGSVMFQALDPSLYLDHSATTPPRVEVIQAMQAALEQHWGNPSSLHGWGQRAALALERSREQVSALLGGDPDQVFFTSGGTEANNLALLGVAREYAQHKTATPHWIISSIEHPSVNNVATQLEDSGWQISRLPVTPTGKIYPDMLQAALRPNTVGVSILHGQNEVGVVQDLEALAAVCREAGILFHSDCVQTTGRYDLREHPCDLISLSAHKLYGPQGVGALFIRSGLSLQPLLQGGGQEKGLRSGTQALPAIVGFGVAAELALQEMAAEIPRLRRLQQYLHQLLTGLPGLILTGPSTLGERLPHHLSYCVENQSGTQIVRRLAQFGIGISAGSACHQGKLSPSPVLLALGYTPKQAMGSIRLSLGKATTQEALDYTAQKLEQVLKEYTSLVG
jgi:cysteine desulfurase